jgi:hypothetical protein
MTADTTPAQAYRYGLDAHKLGNLIRIEERPAQNPVVDDRKMKELAGRGTDLGSFV